TPVETSTRFLELTSLAALASPVWLREGLFRVFPLVFKNWFSAHTDATVVTSLITTKLGTLSKRPSAALIATAVLLSPPAAQLLLLATPPEATMYICLSGGANERSLQGSDRSIPKLP